MKRIALFPLAAIGLAACQDATQPIEMGTLERPALGIASVPPPATLFGTDGSGGNLLEINVVTGAGTVVGPMGAGSFPSLAIDPITGTMYAGRGGGSPDLFTVDPVTGAASLVGSSGLGFAAIGGMNFRSDGTLFAAVNIAGDGGTGSDHLATIDQNTGVATVIGPFGVCTPAPIVVPSDGSGSCDLEGMEAIAFDAAGVLWGAKSFRGIAGAPGLYTIDIVTGAASFVAPILDGIGTPPSGGVVSLQFAPDGTLFGGTARAITPATDGGRLITIDPPTGLFSFVGASSATEFGSSLAALALGATAAPPVDSDGDGVPDPVDACPFEFGPPDNDGCPRPELPPGTDVSNPPADCPIIVDGRFGSNGCIEWAEVTPIVELGGQSIVYQAIAPGDLADGVLEDLYLMYDCICSLTPQQPGDLTAVVTFFVGLDRFDVSIVQGGPNSTGELGDQTIVLRNGVLFDAPGIQGAVDFNFTSPNFPEPHNLVELEVPLLQTPETPGGLPPDQGGIYSPDPSFWGAQVAGSDLIQVSSNIIDIGSGEVVTSTVIPIVIPSQMNIERAKVKKSKKGPDKDDFDFRGRLVLADFDPETEGVIVRLLGAFKGIVLPGSFVRKGKNLDKIEFRAPRGTPGIRKIEIRDDGRFKVQVKDVDLGDIDLSLPVTFSLEVGDEVFDQQVQLDEKGKFRFGPELVPAVEDLIDDVTDLAPDPLTQRQVDKLLKKLEHPLRDLARGKAKGAVKDLKKFIEEVKKVEVKVLGFDGTDVKEDAAELIEMILVAL